MKMEGSVGSGVLKKKSSSGCLIIKKKGLNNNSGGGGLGSSSESSMGKKRVSLAASDSSDEDESLEFMRRKVYDKRLKNGSMGCKRSELETRDNAGIEDGSERKRSRLDLFEFDEYDEFDGKKMRNEFFGHKLKACGGSNSYKMKESGVSFKRNFAVDKGSYRFDGSSSGKSKEKRSSGERNKELLLDDDEAHMPISLLRLKYQETAAESIRLQGKNGVLKVMVNKKKKEFPSSPEDYDPRERKERKGSGSDDVVKKESLFYSDSKKPENRGLKADKERSADKKKKESIVEKVKPSSHKGRKVGDSEVDGVDTVLKLETPRLEASSSKKRENEEAERSPSIEHDTPVKGKEVNEGSAKRGGSTEKQLLREKIRGMLIDAGWTIDYRPRRNRDYLDAVYINPSGTAYWSIVKAYDAFKKLLGEENGKVKADIVSPSIAPLSEDLVNKLTRNTKKKIAEANKRKRKEDGMTNSAKRSAVREVAESSDSDQSEERLSSFMKHKQKSRGKSHKVDKDSDDDLSDEKPPTASKFSVIQGRTNKVTGRCTLLVRGSNRDENSELEGYAPYSGKRTVLSWLIDSGTAKLSEKVQYRNRRRSRVMLEGWITRDGIHCGCCSKILTVSKFELHAGSKLRQPFQNIFLESGSSLLQCQIDAWNNQEESVRQDFFTVDVQEGDPDDDTCGICGDGGDLICCDSCPSTFHQICLGIQMLPLGDWHCPNCACKFCGNVSGCAAEENNSTADELYQCHFCEKKYHKSCSERVNELPQSSNSASFCGLKCLEIYDHLEKILGIRHELEAGISWSLIQRKDVSDTSQRGFPLRVECNAKLAVASSVMDECFLPIIDRRSGINMINNVIYNCGSNFNRLNFCRFYTAILERGDEIISAASIRLHGDRLAEMPFIGTRDIYRRQGMCRRLLSAIETELRSLKVRQLIIPAISEHMNTWSTVFGFHELNDAHKKEIKTMNMLVFPGTDMLQKQLVKHEDSDGTTVSVSTINQRRVPLPVEKGEVNPEQKDQASSDSEGCLKQNTQASNIEDEVPTVSSDAVREPSNTAPKVYVLTKNQHQVPVSIKKGEVNPTLEQNEQASSDSEGCLKQNRQASNIEDEVPGVSSDAVREPSNTAPNGSPAARESDVCLSNNGSTTVEPEMRSAQQEYSDNLKSSAVPAITSDAVLETNNAASSDSDKVCESNVHLANEGSTAFVPEMKNGQKESLDNLQSSPSPAENSCISDKEPGLLESPSKENSSACKKEAPCPESVPVSPDKTCDAAEAFGAPEAEANTSHSMKVSEDAEPSVIVTNGCVSASEFSSTEETTSNPQNCAPISIHPDDEENTAAPIAVSENDKVNSGTEDPSVDQVVDGDNETTDCHKVNSGMEDPSVDQVADGDNDCALVSEEPNGTSTCCISSPLVQNSAATENHVQ